MRLGLVAAVALLIACGDDGKPSISTGNVLEDLRRLPGVASVEEVPTTTSGFHYYVLQFDQPADHADPQGQRFLQRVSLLHRDLEAPMVAYTSGYHDYYNDRVVELTTLMLANQISIEHRFFATSRPEPPDWSKLTIEQMAHDQHAIITSLRSLYPGAFITAGASKGGMTAIYHRRFYPDDVDGTVPYVAPISYGAPDARYAGFLDTLGPPDCRQALRDAAVEMLANRRSAISALAATQAAELGLTYTRIPFDAAVESAIFNVEWSFWQYYGIGWCADVPLPSASDDQLWAFLDDFSPVSDNEDQRIAQFDAYYHQAYHQLGYPDGGAAYLDPYLQFTDADYLGILPTAQPTYDNGAAMADIDQWVRTEGNRLLFIYGQWDPWTGGSFELGNATDSQRFVQAEGSHGARLTRLAAGDRDTAFAMLEAWTGVTPKIPNQTRVQPDLAHTGRTDEDVLRVPPAIIRALSARRKSP